jgi:hypothetical protein
MYLDNLEYPIGIIGILTGASGGGLGRGGRRRVGKEHDKAHSINKASGETL